MGFLGGTESRGSFTRRPPRDIAVWPTSSPPLQRTSENKLALPQVATELPLNRRRRLTPADVKSRTEPKSRGKRSLTDRNRKRPPEATSKLKYGGRPVPSLGPKPSQNLAAPAARAPPSPGSAQAGRRDRVSEHLQSGQALPGVAGLGHRLEGPGEPGGPVGRGVPTPQLGDVRKPGPHWPGALLIKGAAAGRSLLSEQPGSGATGRVSAPTVA